MLSVISLLAPLAASVAMGASSDRFMAALRAEEARSSGGIVQLSDGNFAERVFESDRPYHKVVLFNTRDVRHNCGQCDSFRSEIEMVATAIRKAREDSPDAAPIHIFEADYSANRKMFEKLGIRGVPMLTYYRPTTSNVLPESLNEDDTFRSQDYTAEAAATFVTERAGVQLSIYRSPIPGIITGIAILATLGAGAYFLHGQAIALFMWAQRQQWIWVLGSVFVYFIAISGVLYDIIRGVPFAGVNRKGGIEVFSTQSGMQYALEGIVVGAINTVIGISILVLILWAPKMKGASQTTLVGVCCAVFFFFFMMLLYLYRLKSPWYTPLRLY